MLVLQHRLIYDTYHIDTSGLENQEYGRGDPLR
jgi:hypothetical protein